MISSPDLSRFLLGLGMRRRQLDLLHQFPSRLVTNALNAALVADLSAARDSLEQRVRLRTAELEAANTALQEEMHARARSEQQMRQIHRLEAVGQLTGGIAHDFNNLLAIIQGNAELVSDDSQETRSAMRAILGATGRGAELTRRLVAFSRQQALLPRAIDLAELVAGMSSLLGRTLGETIEIETRVDPGVGSAMADPGQLESALLNLALNARDAMPAGGRLTIECASADADEGPTAAPAAPGAGSFVVLTVRDNGCGMLAEVVERAFEPFFTTKEVGKGSGLGLSMVYGFAKQSGGKVSIDSAPGKGTAVHLVLPRGEGAAPGDEGAPCGPVPRGRGERILVIEDDDELRALAVRTLEGLGYRVVAVADGFAARRSLAEGCEIDLVLSDVVLPGGLSGPELADEIRAGRPGLRVVFMSGYPSSGVRPWTAALGPETILKKPFGKDELAAVLHRALDS